MHTHTRENNLIRKKKKKGQNICLLSFLLLILIIHFSPRELREKKLEVQQPNATATEADNQKRAVCFN